VTSSTASVSANRSIPSTRLRVPSLIGLGAVPAADRRSGRRAAIGRADARKPARATASALACFDVFWALAVVTAVLVFVVLLMKRSVAEKGARIGSE
jgi:hypothetical protein